jgi:hypothetical protein
MEARRLIARIRPPSPGPVKGGSSMLRIAVLCVLAVAVAAGAADPVNEPFKSADAKAAQARFEKEKKNLDDAYQKELRTIQKTYTGALNAARKTALEKNDLDEAQRIAETIKGIEEVEPPVPGKLTAKELVGRRFSFAVTTTATPNGELVLGEDGRIKEYSNDNEKFWKLNKDGKLFILTKDGRVSHSYDAYWRAANGFAFEGKFVAGKPPTLAVMFEVQPKKK